MATLNFFPTPWPLGGPPPGGKKGDDRAVAAEQARSSITPGPAIYPLDLLDLSGQLLGGGSARNSGEGGAPAVPQGAHAATNGHPDGLCAMRATRYTTGNEDASAQRATIELQVKNAVLENTLSDTMVEMVNLREQMALLQDKLQTAHSHIDDHVNREQMLSSTIEACEVVMGKMQEELEERLDMEELLGFRSYVQQREKEVKSRLKILQDENDRKDVIIKEQASEIALLKNVLELRTADLESALDDLKTSAHREWKKHRAICMEIGGVYIDFNHREDVGLVMDRSAKHGADELGFLGIGIKLTNVFPFEVIGVHPDSRTHDGLPAIFHEGDQLIAVEDLNLENLTRDDINGLLIGPADTSVHIKLLRYESGVEGAKIRIAMHMKRLELEPKVEMRKPRRASRKVSTYGNFVQKREYDYHLPPSGSELVGDLEVWEVLLMDGKPSAEHPTAFHFGKKLLHQPTFLEGQDVHGKPVCCVWDVNTGDVYYRGPEGAPLDLEKMAKKKEARRLAQEETLRAAEERRVKMDELESKMRAEVEMRAKLEAEAKLKLERQGLLKQEMLEAARAEIEARVRGTGDLPSLVPRTLAEVKASLSQAKAPPTEPVPTSPRKSSKSPGRHFSKSPRRPAKEEEAKPKTATAVDPTQAEQAELAEQAEQPQEAGAAKRQSGRRHDSRPPPEVEAAASKTTEEEELDQEIARLAAEEAAKRAAEQLARLKTAKAAADEAAAAAPPEEEAQEDEPSAGASAGKSPRKSSKSPGRNERAKSPKGAKKKGKKELV